MKFKEGPTSKQLYSIGSPAQAASLGLLLASAMRAQASEAGYVSRGLGSTPNLYKKSLCIYGFTNEITVSSAGRS